MNNPKELRVIYPTPAQKQGERYYKRRFNSAMNEVKETKTIGERVWGNGLVRKLLVIAAIMAIWQMYGLHVVHLVEEGVIRKNTFPTFTVVAGQLWELLLSGQILTVALTSLKTLSQGYLLGVLIAVSLVVFSTVTRVGQDVLDVLNALFSPLPAVAILPIALLWFATMGESAPIIFVQTISTLFPVALALNQGFKSVNKTLRDVGRNYGFSAFKFARLILIPASLPSLLSGLRLGWSFGWRTLIASELYYGATEGAGGLGVMISDAKNNFQLPTMFAALLTIIVIGLLVEYGVFAQIEKRTVRKWGVLH